MRSIPIGKLPAHSQSVLRITIQAETRQTTFRLEGRLAAAWVAELRRCYREVALSSSNMVVDLDDVTFIDKAGRALLREMSGDGVRLVANDPLMESIVTEVSRREECER